ncbi:translocation/assembly module TamB domain-containing protein, partial [Cyclobacterium sp.]|uniref:translocation/assembly module TamB domain-containing protein n=1 Tax=Cyclobacterium sp. TaxID=1966343 RepID=UPI001996D591
FFLYNRRPPSFTPLYLSAESYVYNRQTLNAGFSLKDEEITLDNQGLYLDQLTIEDNGGNGFTLDGQVLTESFTNPAFDLKLTANNFRFLNSTAEDNDLFYGDAIIDADVSIGGDLNLPEVSANLTVDEGTNLSFVVPESQLDVVEREGVVTYVNREDPEDILTKRLEETSNTGFSGYQVSALLKVSPEAIFNVVIDARSGDNLLVEGAADLQLDLDPNGRINLTGIYELSRGHYELSLYNMVNRRFEIRKGSSITWAGDPLDASMDITAIYRVKTSAVDLMTATAAGGSRENMMQYRQQLPFLVYLNIEGEMLRPLISFTLDMPEDEKGAIGGSVYSQVQQLNNQEGELNRQVFSLLVLNRFFPSGSNTGGGGTTAMAKSSVSQLLSSELNSLTDNALGGTGFELDVDLDSFQDYQGEAPQSRTQLNLNARKRFLDDRLIVQVGSQIDIEGSSRERGAENALLGNVSIEYLLTENGRYRIRGFRKNQFESFIDGQLVVTGFSAIFNREFNYFHELWRGIETKRNGRDPIEDSTEAADDKQKK